MPSVPDQLPARPSDGPPAASGGTPERFRGLPRAAASPAVRRRGPMTAPLRSLSPRGQQPERPVFDPHLIQDTATTVVLGAHRGTGPSDGPVPVVVVGVDGSAASRRALLVAAAEARLRGAVLHIVAVDDLEAAAYGYGGVFTPDPVGQSPHAAAAALVQEAAGIVAADPHGSTVQVRTVVVQGRPSQVLLAAADGAALLVVGARGAGNSTRLLVGSTSAEVLVGATGPVLITFGPDGAAAPAVAASPVTASRLRRSSQAAPDGPWSGDASLVAR